MLRNFILILLFFCAAWVVNVPQPWAEEGSIGVVPVYWQYQESSPRLPGYASTPFTSIAKGWGVQLDASFEQAWGDYRKWSVRVAASAMLPMEKADETWNQTGTTQHNQLDIQQAEGRTAVLRKLGSLTAGFWGSYQWQQQRRHQFVVNGVSVIMAGEPVRENVSSAWVGGMVDASLGKLDVQVEGGWPVWVKVTNSALDGQFNRRSGYRWGASVRWQAIKTAGVDFVVRANYQYRKLGGDLEPFGLWPENRYQTIGAGLALHW